MKIAFLLGVRSNGHRQELNKVLIFISILQITLLKKQILHFFFFSFDLNAHVKATIIVFEALDFNGVKSQNIYENNSRDNQWKLGFLAFP